MVLNALPLTSSEVFADNSLINPNGEDDNDSEYMTTLRQRYQKKIFSFQSITRILSTSSNVIPPDSLHRIPLK